MNPRKIPRNISNNNDPNKEEKTSTNMSIDEDSIINDKDHPLRSNKNYFNSLNINRVSNILANNIIQIPINENIYNTQQRPSTSFSFLSNSELGVGDAYEQLGTNSAFTSKKRKKTKKTAKNKKNSNLNSDIEELEED